MRPALFLVLMGLLGMGVGILVLTLTRGAEPQVAQAPPPANGEAGEITSALTRQDEGQGGVVISVTHATPEYFKTVGEAGKVQEYGLDQYTVFIVKMNTHSMDLSPYKMEAITFLRDDRGNEYPAKDWIAMSNSSHHRSGVVRFPKIDGKAFELVIKGVAGVGERVFRWP